MKLWALLVLAALGSATFAEEEADPPEIAIGERLFLETRFSQFFFANTNGDVNAKLTSGDPVVDTTVTTTQPLPGPFKGEAMNCRACHLVDEHIKTPGGGVRTYADFAPRSPIPDRGDGKTMTLRNSPALVNSSLERKLSFFLHFDGEFATAADLVKGTFTGRNFGWLPGEERTAKAHVVRVIRKDDGSGALAQAFGGPYARVLLGESEQIPEELRLPEEFRLDVAKATDEQVFDLVARLVAAYVRSLEFARDENGEFSGSAYDLFLKKNSLPRKPDRKENDKDYARRLRQQIMALKTPVFVAPVDGKLELHQQDFAFGETELQGLKIFLSEPADNSAASGSGAIGNCIACHAPPNFTDFLFHNTGATQEEYDNIHGDGAFVKLPIPGLKDRVLSTQFLSANGAHPEREGTLASIPRADDPRRVDLGLWNVFGNSGAPHPQSRLKRLMRQQVKGAGMEDLLTASIARFKTPGLRSLGQSAPYFHTGRMVKLTDAMKFYQRFANLSRAGQVRNSDAEIAKIFLQDEDIDPLAAFLRSLNEDYQ